MLKRWIRVLIAIGLCGLLTTMATGVDSVDTADASTELCQNERECRLERRLESLVNSMESLQMLVLQCSLLYFCFALPDADAAGLTALVIVCLAKTFSPPPFLLYGGPALIAIVMLYTCRTESRRRKKPSHPRCSWFSSRPVLRQVCIASSRKFCDSI